MKIDSRLFAQIAAVFLALPILYVAGSGPLLRVNLGQPARPFLEAIYRPLDEITTATHTNGLWRKYLAWWGGYYRLQVYDMSQFAKEAGPVE
ncbi:hypothetical protein CfE428DRAFT_4570 [Chthoniobacter flavus Ellin428]|uniref:Uncharacterized protein n=1 Tax=Chthoniobacter flavus Ellin428 TaxID=497964 RepID=B4D6N0_9BACT|nr:hypothetical protein [Chthoniobacter flavus]EDY17831.1 hypothetical protein CfE428DRAFT_4570 [Chthoniobacter flavus Ellin428]TCO88443.1 hypothetical protein EV701_11745 [Chthoniobacter flavus]